MNQFQSIQTGQAELKDAYNNEPAKEALKRRRQKRFMNSELVQEEDLDEPSEKDALEKKRIR